MNENKDIIFEKELKSQLSGCDFNVNAFLELASTNDTARQMAEEGASEGAIVISKAQTKGRGKNMRVFYSPDDSGLYMSIVLKPDILPSDAFRITCAAGIAVCRALFPYTDKKIGIKWVNDVLIDGKKVCGILTESVLTKDCRAIRYAVLGIGINLYDPEGGFADEIKNTAGSVFGKTKISFKQKAKIAADVITHFFQIYKNSKKEDIAASYQELSLLKNTEIIVLRDSREQEAVALYVDENLNLVVKYENNETEALISGDVTIKKRFDK